MSNFIKKRNNFNNNIINENQAYNNKIDQSEENKIHDNDSALLKEFEVIKKEIPSLPLNLAIMIFLSNLIFPPSGTFYLSCIGDKYRRSQMIVAILQLSTLAFLIGYIWSIYWGILTLKKSY